MTHFTIGIIIPRGRLADAEAFVAAQMAPYDENTTVEPYVCYSVEQAAADIASDRKRLNLIIRRKEAGYDLDRCRQALKELAGTTSEVRYQDRIRHHELFNDLRQPLSTYNPKSKWDWYVIGGRWDGWINDRETHAEYVGDNLATTKAALVRGKIPHAIVTPDGEWHERGRMGWWAILLTENENWDEEARAILRRYPGHQVAVVDAHI